MNTKGKGTKENPIRHITLHCTGTKPDVQVKHLDMLPYHYLITRNGRLLNLKPVRREDSTIEVAWLGGLDKNGNGTDNRTEPQNETLFNTLVWLTERFTEARIMPADKVQAYTYPNPGFDVKAWLGAYIPSVLAA